MSEGQSFTLYTYSSVVFNGEARWHNDGIGDEFFTSEAAARQVILDLRDDISSDPDGTWSPMNLERIETVAITQDNLVALLNDGVGAIIQRYEIVETIDRNSK